MKIHVLLSLAASLLLSSCGGGSPSQTSDTSNINDSSSTSKTSEQSDDSISLSSSGTSALPEIDYVKVFCETKWENVWAWDDEGDFFPDWPGPALQEYDSNWKTYDFKGRSAPFNIIFNRSGEQTANLSIPSVGYWWYYQNNWYQTDPLDIPPASSTSVSIAPPSTDELDNRHRTWYQLLVYSFADGSGNDGIGDFKGIVDHLDYLQNLGIGGIWLSPIHPASHYHGYDVLDYYGVNSVYEQGGVTFEQLLQECHNRGIKVLLDMVLNHTSKDHPWRSQHPDWYSGEQIFSDWMPDLNYDNQEVRSEIKNVGRYWLNKGVDGFRCDGATWIYGGGGGWNVEQNKFNKTLAWWSEFYNDMKSVKSDVYIVGETWTTLNYVEQFFSSGCSAFNFSAYYWALQTLNNSNGMDSSKWLGEYVTHQQNVRNYDANGVEASFLSNHDTGRIAMGENMNAEKLKLANAINVLAPGGSFLYYGDELGLRGEGGGDMSLRTPMPFSTEQTNSGNYMEGNYRNTYTVSGQKADQDAANANSLYSSLASVIHYKNANPALYLGGVSKITTGSNNLGAMKYVGASAEYCLFLNASSNAVTATVSGNYEQDFTMVTGSTQASLNNGSLSIPAYSLLIAKGSGSITVTA